jgi:hypothetical protein
MLERNTQYWRYETFEDSAALHTLDLSHFLVSPLQEASRIFGLGKETAFHKLCTDDYLELSKDQEASYIFVEVG